MASPTLFEKPPVHRMMVLGELLMISVLPEVVNVALPLVTTGPLGLACAAAAKQEATATVIALRWSAAWLLLRAIRCSSPGCSIGGNHCRGAPDSYESH